MPKVAVVHHLESPFLGLAEGPLRDAGVELVELDRRRGAPLPEIGDVDGILSLGGEQSVLDRDPLLDDEAALLGAAVDREVPVLAICLGAQILAEGLGGHVLRVGRAIEWRSLRRRREAAGDPIARALPDPHLALHWNEDAFTLPPGAIELFDRPAGQVEGFRAGTCAWGLQFHPDVDAERLETWYRLPGWLAEAGLEEAAVRAEDRRRMPDHIRSSAAVFSAWAAVVRARVPA